MKNKQIQEALDRRLSGMTVHTEHIEHVLRTEGEEPMKKQLSVGFVLAMALVMMTLAALAAELSGSYISNVFKKNHGIELTEEAQALFRREKPLAVVELKDAVVTIREAAADGRAVYVCAEVQKKENANIIMAPEATGLEDGIEWLNGETSYGEYSKKHDVRILETALGLAVNGAEPGDMSGSEVIDENGAHMLMEMNFAYTTEEKSLHMTGNVYAGEPGKEATEIKEFAFDIPVAKVEEKTYKVGQKVPGSKVVLDELKLTKSPLTMYYEAAYHFEDEQGKIIPPTGTFGEKAQLYFFDWNFEHRILNGTLGGGTTEKTETGFVEKSSMDLKDFPRFGLLLYVGGEAPDTINGSLEISMQ